MRLLGLPFHAVGVEEVCAFIEGVISRNEKAVALNLNIHCVNLALKYPWLHEFIRGAQLVFCDGDGVRWGLRLLGYSPPPKITYNKWLWQLCEFCEKQQYRIFFLGAKPGVAEEAALRLKEHYPRLQVAGTYHGYFKKEGEENEKVLRAINRVRPDILLVCFGMPSQEEWIRDHWKELNVHVFLKGGAAFDYASGRLTKAPEWMIRWNLEWLFRLLQEPRRLFGRYVFGIPLFFLQVFFEKLREGGRKEMP